MSIDRLHNKIRKLKNPSVVNFEIDFQDIPQHILTNEPTVASAYGRFCREILQELNEIVPAVRFSFGYFSMLGAEGLNTLSNLLCEAKELGYYVILDAPEILSPKSAQFAARCFAEELYPCDAVVISPYIGSDAIKPFAQLCKEGKKVLFAIVRSPNKSAPELQDLQFGTRQVHAAAANLISRNGEAFLGKCGYSQLGALVSAGTPDILRNLRAKYPRLYLLVDGLDYPSGNSKNCSYAFDKFGYGAVVCAGTSVTAAWKEADSNGEDYLQHVTQAAEKMKRNLTRYINVL